MPDADHDDMRRINVKCHQATAARTLEEIERQASRTVANWTAEGMIRAAADWLFDKIGPRETYDIVQRIADDIGLRIAATADAPRPEPKR